MRLSTLLPCAFLVATASFATAMDTNTFAPRAQNGLSLSARELDAISLLTREYIAEALVARADKPQRQDFKNFDDYEKAWLAWNRRNRKIDHGMQKIIKQHKPTDRPQREHFGSHEEYEKAFVAWNRANRKADHASQSLIKGHVAKGEKEQAKIRAKANGEKKPGFMSKLLGKGKRELAYEWDELE